MLSAVLLFLPLFSISFYIVYLLAGITDMIDGTIARRRGTSGEFGAKLDSIADFIFIVVCLVRILPAITIPVWLWVWVGVIAAIKITSIILGIAFRRELVVEHTLMNKLTGLLLFAFPLTVSLIEINYSGAVLAVLATFAALQEGYYILTSKSTRI